MNPAALNVCGGISGRRVTADGGEGPLVETFGR